MGESSGRSINSPKKLVKLLFYSKAVGSPSLLHNYMPGNIAVPSNIIVPSSATGKIQKRLVLRNTSQQTLLVKLVIGKHSKDVIAVEHQKLRMAPSVTLQVDVSINCDKMSNLNRFCHKIAAYVMPIQSPYQQFGEWLNSPEPGTVRQLAFELTLKACNEFSANDIVIDMPGRASLIEPIPQAIPLMDHLVADVQTARDIDDAPTARAYGSQEQFVAQMRAAGVSGAVKNADASCWLMGYATKYFVPTLAEAPEKDKHASKKSLKPERSEKSEKITSNKGSVAETQKSCVKAQSCGKSVKTAKVRSAYVNSEINATPCGGS